MVDDFLLSKLKPLCNIGESLIAGDVNEQYINWVNYEVGASTTLFDSRLLETSIELALLQYLEIPPDMTYESPRLFWT